MKLDTARQHITTCRDRMNALYNGIVFDEWVVVAMRGGLTKVLHYEGPRAESFERSMLRDAAHLCDAMEGRNYSAGDFEFVHHADGSHFDASVKLGEGIFLLCNQTEGSMNDLRASPRWREAQKPFVTFCEKFLADPLS